MKNSTDIWEASNLLKTFEDSSYCSVQDAAIILENQTRYNETLNDIESDINSHLFFRTFREISIPTVFRILTSLQCPKLVRFEPIKRNARRQTWKSFLCQNEESPTETLVKMSQEVVLEMDQHILNIIKQFVGTLGSVDINISGFEGVIKHIKEVSRHINNKSGENPDWIIAESHVANYLKENCAFEPIDENSSLGIRPLGKLQLDNLNLLLLEDTITKRHQIILGVRHSKQPLVSFRPKLLLGISSYQYNTQHLSKASLMSEFEINVPKDPYKFYGKIILFND